MIDADVLSAGLRIPAERAAFWAPYLGDAMEAFEITGPYREAAFLAQCAHESTHLTRWVENLNYSTAERLVAVFGPKRFGGTREEALNVAARFVRNPAGLAEFVYGNRTDLGNTSPGDGARFIGRGLIQLTGRRNYTRAAEGLDVDYVGQPKLLEEPEHAALASAWWWADQVWAGSSLNQFADDGLIDCISGLVNRGNPNKQAIGADERRRIYHDMLDVLTA